MKKALFSALTVALLYGCASTPVETEKPAASGAEPAQGLPVSPPPGAPGPACRANRLVEALGFL